MNIKFWINFDLNANGDYDGLYKWLDKRKALEKGINCALIENYYVPDKEINGLDSPKEIVKVFIKYMSKELLSLVKIKKSDRIHIILYAKEHNITGGFFLVGKQKASPWKGAYLDDANTDINLTNNK